MIFERFECGNYPNATLQFSKCDVRLISRKAMKFDIVGHLNHPVKSAFMHTVLYYRYNTYKKYAWDLWEDFCGYLDGSKKSYFLDFTLKRVLNFTNVNRPCPFEGDVFVKINNISLEKLPFEPLLPAGRYRLDINFTDSSKKHIIFTSKLFGSVSDHRIERY